MAILLVLVALSICALMITAIAKARSEARAQAHLKASYLAEALAEDVAGGLEVIVCVSQALEENLLGEDKGPLLARIKEHIAKYVPSVTAVSVFDPQGKVLATTQPQPGPLSAVADARILQDRGNDEHVNFHIGEPIAVGGLTILPVTTRLETPSGQFAGRALFEFNVDLFPQFYNRIDLNGPGTVEVIGTDGIVRAGFVVEGGKRRLIGAPTAVNEKVLEGALSSSSGFAESEGGLYAWRRLDSFPLLAVVGLTQAQAEGGAYRQAATLFGLGLASIALLICMMVMLAREVSRRIRQARALDHQRHRLRASNAELAIAKRRAEAASHSKSIFIANLSHDLRTPLNAILGFAEIIRDRLFGSDCERYAGYAADIHSAGRYLLDLTTGLLDLAKIEAGKFELNETWFPVVELVAECLEVVRFQAESRGLSLSASQHDPDLSIYGDRTALKQILINLLSNAAKFSHRGGVISICAELAADCWLELTIEDKGIGMSAADVAIALKPFQQVENRISPSQGTGLGLPLAAQLTELHGGSLRIDSEPGVGTAVRVRLPPSRVSHGP